MERIKILTKDQVFGNNILDIFKINGSEAVITDFAILLGGYFKTRDTLSDRVGNYWIDTEVIHGNLKINYVGFEHEDAVSARSNGIRLAKDIKSIDKVPSNNKEVKCVDENFYKVEYGYFPQMSANKNEQEKLNEMFDRKLMKKTGNIYTTDTMNQYSYVDKFKPQIFEEYEYKNNRYVRVPVNAACTNIELVLSNGEKYTSIDYVWIKVEPIQWWIDEKAKIMVSEKILLSGIQFSNLWGISNYEDSFLKEYINTYMEKEINK